MDKLKLHSPDLSAGNIDKLAEQFPACVTESRNEDGSLKRAIDFDLLRQELSDHIVEGPQERYRLDWPGKREALLAANAPIAKTLRPCREESVDFDTTQNLFIEGDNLDALKLLQETYLGKVKMIYIDPPYNTGKDFIYEDDFAESSDDYLQRSNQYDEEGRLIANTEANGRFHSDWLSMIYPRLRLAQNVLTSSGIAFISIDDGEVSNLRKLCDEVFGSENFMAQFVWKSRNFTDARALTKISTDHEYLLCYARSSEAKLRGNPRDETKYKNPDEDSRGSWMSRSILGLATQDQRPNLHYPITDPSTGISFDPPADNGWRYGKERMSRLIAEGSILFPEDKDGRPREKKYREDIEDDFTSFPTIIDDIFTSQGTAEIKTLFKAKVFDFPKPHQIVQRLVEQCTNKSDIILDFFSGSATTAHAVMALNAEDGGARRCMSVQLPEVCATESEACRAGYKTIAEIAKERIRRAGQKIKADNVDKPGIENLDIGFRVLKIDTSNMAEVYYRPDELKQGDLLNMVDNVRPDRTAEDLLFQVLLDWGVDLTLPISREQLAGREVFFVDGNALAACFVADGSVDETFVKQLAARKPLRAVFRDAGFASDNARINVEQIFKTLSPATEVKTL